MAMNSITGMYGNNKNNNKPQKLQFPKKVEKTDKTDIGLTVTKTGLSDKAKAYLKKLQEKYGNVNFVIGEYSDKEKAAVNGGGKAYNCFINEDLLERMAADGDTAKKYESILDDAIIKVDELKKNVEEKGLGKYVQSYGITINGDGKVDYIVMLKDSFKAINDKYAEKNAEKKADEKKGNPNKPYEKVTSLRDESIDALMERLLELIEGKGDDKKDISRAKNKDKNTDIFITDVGEFAKKTYTKFGTKISSNMIESE